MKSGTCPKCGSATIYSRPQGIGFAQQSSVYVYDAGSKFAKPSSTKAYACATCGYFEVYMIDTSVLSAVAGAWSRVPPK
jgi:predicted nucleic-acid-binding Zn-ribbon protein